MNSLLLGATNQAPQVMKEYEMLKTCCAGDPQKRPAFNDISTTGLCVEGLSAAAAAASSVARRRLSAAPTHYPLTL